MELPDKVPPAVSQKCWWQEIPRPEFQRYGSELLETLEAVCGSSPFRTSPKSCEFLRHIVLRSLEGDTDGLKERLIGMELLGRDPSYDTATDACVRVRANDVRKRLKAHSKNLDSAEGFCFELPAGTYIPVFYRAVTQGIPAPETPSAEDPAPMLSFYRLAAPALAALFLCVICMRWEFAQANSFLRFWSRVLPDDRALLCVQPARAQGDQEPTAIRELRLAAPLLDLAGQLHHSFTVVSVPAPLASAGGMLVYVGDTADSVGQKDAVSSLLDANPTGAARRFVVEETPAGRRIIDRQSGSAEVAGGALLTVISGPRPLLWIDGTDDAAIRSLVDRLCDQNAFPVVLADSFQADTMTQAVFPTWSKGKPTIVRMPLPRMQAALEPEP